MEAKGNETGYNVAGFNGAYLQQFKFQLIFKT